MGTIWEIPLLLSIATGARRSEILGLSWENVDLRSGILHIRRGVQRLPGPEPGGTISFTPLKTKRARRSIEVPGFAVERLRGHRREQLERRTTLGARWCDPLDEEGAPVALVCERGDGSFLHPDSFTHAFKRFGRLAGLHPSTRLHDVRHAVATELGRQGVHGVIVSAVLRHASPAFTVAVYQHAWQDGPHEAAAALERALRSGVSDVGNPLARDVFEPGAERASIAN
jgi:integrase